MQVRLQVPVEQAERRGKSDGTRPAAGSSPVSPRTRALVSQADFIAAQEATAPRGPMGPATRRYLLAGLLACSRCGRSLGGINVSEPESNQLHIRSLSPESSGWAREMVDDDDGPWHQPAMSRVDRTAAC